MAVIRGMERLGMVGIKGMGSRGMERRGMERVRRVVVRGREQAVEAVAMEIGAYPQTRVRYFCFGRSSHGK